MAMEKRCLDCDCPQTGHLVYLKCEPCAKWIKRTHVMASSIKMSQYIVERPTSHDDPELVNIVKTTFSLDYTE